MRPAFNTFSNLESRGSPVRWSPARRRLRRRCRSIPCPPHLNTQLRVLPSLRFKKKKAGEPADSRTWSKVLGRKSMKKSPPQQRGDQAGKMKKKKPLKKSLRKQGGKSCPECERCSKISAEGYIKIRR
ncbi:hypothetical protein J6590_047434 [Homalodisca vitripennis]|nr:hypothetical protein J6590_047434 [Homalodisca vitripennis]